MDDPKKAILARLDGLLAQTNRFQEEIREIRKEVGNWEAATNEILPPEQEVAKVEPPLENKMPEKVKPAELEALFYQIDHNFGRETKHQAPIEDKKTEKKPVIDAPIPKPEPNQPSWLDKILAEGNWEKLIGENLIKYIGVTVFVLGVIFFVRYAIEEDWIPKAGRVAIGVLTGGVLLGFAHFLKENFKAFSSVLVGGGISILYFTVYWAFHEYGMFSQIVTFLLMVAITAFTVVLSLAYDRKELAVLAIIGGFGTPLMASSGGGNYIALFTYLCILNAGMLALAFFKKWNIVNFLSYFFTLLLYGTWLTTKADFPEGASYGISLFFATIFYAMFFVMNLVYNLRSGGKFIPFDIALLAGNSFAYFGSGIYIVNLWSDGYYNGLFTAFIAMFNFAAAFTLYKKEQLDKNVVLLLIGLVLTFVSLIGPIQLDGNYITLFWASEAVLLLWLSQQAEMPLLKKGYALISVLMLLSLLMDYKAFYQAQELAVMELDEKTMNYVEKSRIYFTPLLNKAFMTSFAVLVSLAAGAYLLGKEKQTILFLSISASECRKAVVIGFWVIFYIGVVLEIVFQTENSQIDGSFMLVILSIFNISYGLLLWFFVKSLEGKESQLSASVVLMVFLASYLLIGNPQAVNIRDMFLLNAYPLWHFQVHYLTVLLSFIAMGALVYYAARVCPPLHPMRDILFWFVAAVAIIHISAETDHLLLLSSYNGEISIPDLLRSTRKISYAVVWGICSLLLMLCGFRFKIKTLRVISLTLFFLALAKFFVIDFKTISNIGRIIAAISLGLLLLIVAFLYQKLKSLILDQELSDKTMNNTIDNEDLQ